MFSVAISGWINNMVRCFYDPNINNVVSLLS